jgi:pyridoxamine 5'-phosphate oxidase
LDIDECISFAKENPICFIATIEGNQPRVRGFQLWRADKTGLYYSTVAGKDVVKQLTTNPRVEVCFFDSKSKDMKQIRITGTAQFVDDLEMKKQLIDARPFLKKAGITPESQGLIIIRVVMVTAFMWTFSEAMAPKKVVSFA